MESKTKEYLIIAVSVLVIGGSACFLVYIYQEGLWKDILYYYKFFFDPKNLKSFVLSYGEYAPLVFICLQALQVVFAPVPGEFTGFVGGLVFGTVKGVVFSTVGLTLGSVFAFLLSRVMGMRFVEKAVKREYIDSFNHFITHKGLGLVFVLYLIPGFPKDSLCYLLGLTQIGIFDFIVINVLGRLPGTFMLSLQGNALRNSEYRTFAILLFFTVFALLVLYVSRKKVGKLIGYPVHLLLRKRNY